MEETGSELRRLLDRMAALAVLLVLAAGTVLVLEPFFSPLLWGAVLSFSTWPAHLRLRAALGGRRAPAALAMTLALAAAFVLPLALVGTSLAGNARALVESAVQWLERGPPGPPGWLEALPVLGSWIASYWRELAGSPERILPLLQPLLGPLRDLAVAGGVMAGSALAQMSMAVLAAFFFYRDGERIGAHVRAIAARVLGERAEHFLQVTETTVRGIVYGTVGTAIVQAALSVIGFLIAGVPAAFVLGFATFVLALFPVGAPLVWLPTALWLYHASGWPWALFMLLWGGLVVSGSDNVVRPWLISRGARLPFLVVFMGVIGGAMAFGFLGIFLGPTLLALALALLAEWSREDGGEEETARGTGSGPVRS